MSKPQEVAYDTSLEEGEFANLMTLHQQQHHGANSSAQQPADLMMISRDKKLFGHLQHHSSSSASDTPSETLSLQSMSPVLYAQQTTATVPIEPYDDEGLMPTTSLEILYALLQIAVPAMLTSIANMARSYVAMVMVGRMHGAQLMASSSVGDFFFSFIALHPGVGLTMAVDTLAAQEFGRNPDSDVQGEVTQRSMLVSTGYWILMSFALQNCYSLLQLLFECHLVDPAYAFLWWSPLILLPMLYCASLSKFVTAQNEAALSTYASVVSLVAFPIFGLLLIPTYGVRGVAWAMAATAWGEFGTLAVMIHSHAQVKRRFGRLSLRRAANWEGLKEFMSYAAPSVIFASSESGAFDITMLISTLFGIEQAAAWTVVIETALAFASCARGISAGASAVIGRFLGANRPKEARHAAWIAFLVTSALSLLNGVLILTFHDQLFSFMIDDVAVLRQTSQIIWVLPLLHIGDCIQFVFQGIFSGAGQNHLGAGILLASLWTVGVGAVLYMVTVLEYGLVGIATGLTIGLAVEAPALIATAFCYFDWPAIAKAASINRVRHIEYSFGESFEATSGWHHHDDGAKFASIDMGVSFQR